MKLLDLFESTAPAKLSWDSNPRIGWWRDSEILTLYHGTNVTNLENIAKDGLNRLDKTTGMISFAFEPFTARAFAVMGGEADFRAAGSKAKTIPESNRVVCVFQIPANWIHKFEDPDLRGNDPQHLKRLRSQAEYESWDGTDQQYYQLCELRVSSVVPKEFFTGYMIK